MAKFGGAGGSIGGGLSGGRSSGGNGGGRIAGGSAALGSGGGALGANTIGGGVASGGYGNGSMFGTGAAVQNEFDWIAPGIGLLLGGFPGALAGLIKSGYNYFTGGPEISGGLSSSAGMALSNLAASRGESPTQTANLINSGQMRASAPGLEGALMGRGGNTGNVFNFGNLAQGPNPDATTNATTPATPIPAAVDTAPRKSRVQMLMENAGLSYSPWAYQGFGGLR